MLIRASNNSSSKRFKMSCVITDKRGNVISVGWNKYKTHPTLGGGNFGYIHAECDALLKAFKVNKVAYRAIVYRRNHNLSKPCTSCMEKLTRYGIKEVIYSSIDWKHMKIG